jgi:PPP family 3-phenylpropionic acid transporter
MRVIAIVVSQGLAATAQTIYGTIGIGAAVTTLTFASGLLYQHLGGRAFWVMSAICVAAIPMALRIQVREVIVHQKLPTA